MENGINDYAVLRIVVTIPYRCNPTELIEYPKDINCIGLYSLGNEILKGLQILA